MRLFGLDISLKHYGLVEVDGQTGQVLNYQFMTDSKKFVNADPKHGILYKVDLGNDPETENFRRVEIVENSITSVLWTSTTGFIMSIESYGFATMSPKFAEIAEQTGAVKRMVLRGGGQYRLHDPDSVKLFGAANGHALKKDMVLASSAASCGGFFFFPGNLLKKINKKIGVKKQQVVEEYDGPGTDLADAYWLAQLLRTEMLLRNGLVALHDLPENQIRVFNRVTKCHPVNILDRPFARYVSSC